MSLMTQCNIQNSTRMEFFPSAGKKVVADFSGGDITSDACALLLGEIDKQIGLTQAIASCIHDKRQAAKVRQSILDLIRERIFFIASGYEDCNDADTLKSDPVFKLLAGRCPQSDNDLASQPTLSRFENSINRSELYNIAEVFVSLFIQRHKKNPPEKIILDADATDDPAHGQQEFSFYHGYYENYCYLPLLVFAQCGREEEDELLAAVLRRSNIHGGYGTVSILKRIVTRLRTAFPNTKILFRGDSAFALPEIYQWCETGKINYLIGLPKNNRLLALAEPFMYDALAEYEEEGEKVRRFYDIEYAAGSWKRERRVILKAEVLFAEENPRFVVTNLTGGDPEDLYELYVKRGDSENRIKELKLDLNSGRTSCHGFRANQFRLLLHAASYILLQELRKCLEKTELAKAQVRTLRAKLLKIGAWVKETVRRVWIRMAGGFPLKEFFFSILCRIRCSPAP